MIFTPLENSLKVEWDKIAHLSDDAWLFHLYDWLKLEEKVWGLERKSFLVEHEGRFIGIVPLQMNKKSRVLKSDLMGDCGVALVNDLHPSFREKVLKGIYQHIEVIARQNTSPAVEIYLTPLSETILKDRWQVNPLLHFHYQDISTHTLIVDLTQSKEAILANLSADARLQMRKAKDAGYSLRVGSGIEKYYELHVESYKRTGVAPHPQEYFENIYALICQKGHACLWEAIDAKGETVAFEMIALFKGKAFYWTSCCKNEHLESGVNYLMQANSMLWAREQGATYFETGEIFPGARGGKEKGLTGFKEKFGGEVHRLLKGRLEMSAPSTFKKWARLSMVMLKDLFKARNACDDSRRN